jgi:adenylate cyclase
MSQGKSTEEAFNDLKPPVDDSPWHEMLVDYAGTQGFQQFPYYSFADVVENKVPAEAFKDKIIFVGGTAVGLFDFKSVPNISNYPGVEIHANALDNLLNRRFLNKQSDILDTVFFMVVFGLICGFLALQLPTWAGAISATLLLGYFIVCQWLFVHRQIVLNYLGPAFGVLFSYVVVFFYRFRKERKEKQKLRTTFSQYMAPEVVEVVMKMDLSSQLVGQDREMTVFFSDLAGFTTISESMTPKELVSVLNEYLTEMSEVIFKYGGIVDKFIGDAIMAFWNAPLNQPNHAQLACLTALDQVEKLRELQKRFAERKLPLIDFRAGINTGHMVVGNMGSNQRKDYTVMGDSVNLASRLEGANKPFHTRLMISEFTYEKAKDAVEVRPLDLLRVKGKKIPINVYELAARKDGLAPAQKTGFAAYQEGMTH